MRGKMNQAAFEGFVFEIPESVYEPAEDSFLLAEFSKGLDGEILDMGTGCGIQAIVARKARALGVDMNGKAVEAAAKNANRNGSSARFLVSNLFEKLPNEEFDAIMFNPPYLPTSEEDKVKGPENIAYDGGESGREVLERFLAQFPEHLKPKGKLLHLLSTLSDKGETEERLRGLGFAVNELARKHVGLMEELFVIESSRNK